jgi:thioredoxin reductase
MLMRVLLLAGFCGLVCQKSYGVHDAQKKVIPLLIVGGGVAGLSAAEYGSRAHIPTVLFTGEKRGGQIIDALEVENIPGLPSQPGIAIIDRLEEQALTFGAAIVEEVVTEIVPVTADILGEKASIFLVKTASGREVYALAIIIATGASQRRLEVPGEEEFWGNGVHTCPRCDALFYKGQDVAVVGGGDTAVEYAEMLAAYANKVIMLIHSPAMRANPHVESRLRKYGIIEVMYHQQVVKIMGTRRMQGIELEDMRTGERSFLPIAALFLAIGHEPTTSLVSSLVDLTPTGHILLTKRTQETSYPGMFAAGDAADSRYRQAGVAAGDGIKAALDAVQYLHDQGMTEHVMRNLRSAGMLFNFDT